MKINQTSFGSITIENQIYNYDVYILANGKIMKRTKKNSPRIHGHRALGIEEINFVMESHPNYLFIGKGQSGVLPYTDEVENFIRTTKINIIQDITPNLIKKFNQFWESGKKMAGIFHTTC